MQSAEPTIVMIYNPEGLALFLKRDPYIASQITVLVCDKIGFRADVGTKKNERFDYPFNSGAFYEILRLGERAAPKKEPIYVAQCPNESMFVRCRLSDGHAGECDFPVNPALALTRDVLKAQIALWDAQGTLEGHIATSEFMQIDVTEESTSEASGLYAEAVDVDEADDAEILRIYHSVLALGAAEKKPKSTTLAGRVEEARTLARQAELAIRHAGLTARDVDLRAVPAWIVIHDLIEPQTKIHDRLSLLSDLLKEGGAK